MADSVSAVASISSAVIEKKAWTRVLLLPCRLRVDLPIPNFTVADTLGLRRGSVINARWRVGEDIPLRLNGELVACGAFEVVGNHLAVRLTDLV
jgi:flagellar motor switch/type III secretory pathway protein FliN